MVGADLFDSLSQHHVGHRWERQGTKTAGEGFNKRKKEGNIRKKETLDLIYCQLLCKALNTAEM